MVQLLKIFSEGVIKVLPFRTRPLENDFRLNIILPCEGQVVKTLGHELTCEQVSTHGIRYSPTQVLVLCRGETVN